MTIKELIEILQRQENQDAIVIIGESKSNWEDVLVIIDNLANPDDVLEIHLGGI